MANFDQQNFILTGKTIGSLRRNVVAPLKRMLLGRGMVCIDHRADNMIEVAYLGRVNYFYLFGGKDESSQDLVQGITAAGAYFDEVALQPESFVNQAVGRCSVDGAKIWFNCNPESPHHWFKEKWIDKAKELGLYVMHFLMDDNPSLSEDTKARYKQLYAAGSIFYKRYILGLWVAAEGRVFSFFDEAPGAGYVVDTVPENFTMYLCGLDYGISNPFAAQLWGLSGGIWYVLKEYYWDSQVEKKQKSNAEYIEDLARLCYWNGERRTPVKILIPPEENGFQREVKQSKHPQLYHVRDADNAIMPGIEDLTTLLTLGKLKILRSCEKTIWGINELLWDEKKQKQGVDMFLKGGSGSPDHSADASRYIAREAAKQLRQMRLL